MQIYRIVDSRHPVSSGTGAMLIGGRFNSPGRPVIYGALSFAGAMLEVLVHARIGKVPRHQVWVKAEVPNSVAIERIDVDELLRGWDGPDPKIARAVGDRWIEEGRTPVLIVPSVVARTEFNALVNPAHPDAKHLSITEPQPVVWDERLFTKPQ
jgi:RES domain-containing protein